MPNQAEKIKKALKTMPVTEEIAENETESVGISDLKKGLADAENRNNAVESNRIIAKNEIEELRVDLIKDLLGRLKELGVDPGDNESINNFLKNLEMQDPDLKELFEGAFNSLLGEEQGLPQAPEATPPMPGMMPKTPLAATPAPSGPPIPGPGIIPPSADNLI